MRCSAMARCTSSRIASRWTRGAPLEAAPAARSSAATTKECAEMLRRMFLRNVLGLLAAAMILAIGCSGANKAKYIPSEDRARLALEAALTAWQKGEPFGTKIQIDGSSVDVNDSKWQKGEKLLSFEI